MIPKLKQHHFLLEELVKRDFKKKYKGTILGMGWSILSPLITLLVMRLIFTQFFGQGMAHYTTYLFCGNLIFAYFSDASAQGMRVFRENCDIFSKVKVPKYLFLFSINIQALINFSLTICVFFLFCAFDGITFTWKFLILIYPIGMLWVFNIGVGLILSTMFVLFKDIKYLWTIFTQLLMYSSAIFYTIEQYEPMMQKAFFLNPIYLFISYFRSIVIYSTIPSIWVHLLILGWTVIVIALGSLTYKKCNTKFLYYI